MRPPRVDLLSTVKPLLDSGTPVSPAALVEVVERLEVAACLDVEEAEPLARLAEQAAAGAGNTGLVHRVRVLRADIFRRLGALELAVTPVREGIAWAEAHQDEMLRARAHRVWSSLFRNAGDLNQALEHAVLGVQHIPSGAAPPIKPYHVVGLATILDELGSTAEAMRLYNGVLAEALAEGQWPLALLVLNNRAYSEYERDDVEAAARTVSEMRELARQHHIALDGMELDTIARVQLQLGRPDDAVETLEPIVEGGSSVPLNERASWADCMLTYAEAERRLGRLDAAQDALDRTRRFCEEMGLRAPLVRVREGQAELYAAAGRWRDAYDEYRRFHAEAEALRSHEGNQLAHLMDIMLQVDQARRDSAHYRQLATEDPLTGARNRRWIEDELERRAAEASEAEPLSVALIDVDRFKAINDTYSHAVGDGVLRAVSDLLQALAPPGASLGRLGGDEFILIMPRTGAATADAAALTIRDEVMAHDWGETSVPGRITVTIGVTTSVGGTERADLLARADANLYLGKRGGRNRVVGARPQPAG